MKKRIAAIVLVLTFALALLPGAALAGFAESDWVETGTKVNIGYHADQLDYMKLNGTVRSMRYTYFNFQNKDGNIEEHPVYCLAPEARGAFELVRDDGTTGDGPNTAEYLTGDKVTRTDYVAIMETGYPHQTIASIGVNSANEGYYATKMALWMVILGITPDSGSVAVNTAHSDQAAAQRVYNAAIKIYNNAQANMWQGISDPKVEIVAPTAGSSWKLSADAQWYEMTLQVRTNKYLGTDPNQSGEVQLSWDTSTGAIPEGIVVLNGTTDITSTMKPIAANKKQDGVWRVQTITIRVPAQVVDAYSDNNETATVFPMPSLNALAKDIGASNFYVAAYSSSTSGSSQPYLIEGDRKVDVSTAFQTAIPLVPGNDDEYEMGLRVIKLETGTLIPLAGAVFEIYNPRGQLIGSYATDANGEINLPLGEAGLYTIKETIPPQYYILPTHTSQQVQVNIGEVSTVTVTNDPYGSLRVEKRDSANGRLLGGAAIQIKHIANGATYSETTDASGVAEFLNLPVGGYEIREIIAPTGYALDTSAHTLSVRPQTEGMTSYTLTNLANPGLRITKLDRATMTPIEGVVFEIWHDGQLYGEYATNVAGEILLIDLPVGTYTAREKSTVAPYVLDTTAQWIEISAGQGIAELIFLNDLKPGIYLIKLDAVTMQPLVNAKFKITNVGGTFENEYTTDQNGEIDLSGLEPGAYQVVEITAPDGYLIDDAIRTIQINGGENARFVFTNTRKPSMELVKYDPVNNEYLGGATFRIAKIADGSNYLDRITDVNGRIRIDDLEPGIYSVQEIAAPSGYVLNETEYHVELFPGKTSQIVVENVKKPSLIVWKYDMQTAQTLPDTEFSIAKKGGSIIYEGVTNGDGYIRLDNLDVGWYTVTELAPPPGYLPGNPSTKDVYLEPGKTVEIKFDNLRCPTLTIIKLDSVTHEPIKNVQFNVKFSPEVNFTGGVIDLGNYYTDENGRILLDNNLQAGWYLVTELATAAGYIMKEPIVQEIFLRGGEDKTLTFENIPKSALVVRKIDSATGLPVNGATFEVRYLAGTSGSGGTLIKTVVTSENGTATLTGLAPGTYVVEETLSAPGYQLSNPAVQTAYIGDSDQVVVELVFTNLKMGHLVITKLDSVTKKPVAGVTFLVTDSSGAVIGPNNGEYTTDASGVIEITEFLPIGGTINVKEIRGPNTHNMDAPPQSVKIAENTTHRLTFYNSPKSSAQIIKIDAVTKQPLKGAKFTVYKMNGEIVGTYETNGDGVIILDQLEPGWFKAAETKAPDGYVIDDTPQDFQITNNQFVKLVFENKPVPSLQIIKLDEETRKPIPGVEFTVAEMNGKRIGTYHTDSQGLIYLPELAAGWYTVTEVKAADGYLLDASARNIEIIDGKTAVLEITNKKAASILLRKIDSVTGTGIYGVTFLLSDENRNPIGEYISDQDGYVWLNQTLEDGKYYLREIKPAPGYLNDDEVKTIYVTGGKCTEIIWKNTSMKGQIVITKLSSDYNPITNLPEGSPLAGAVFEVRNLADNLIQTITSDSRGIAATGPLAPDVYVVTEITPPSYYSGTDKELIAQIKHDGDIVRFTVYNKSISIGVTVDKKGNNQVQCGDTMRYDLYNVGNTSSTPLSSFYLHDRLPTDAVRITKLFTGTWNQRLNYTIYFKTNYKDCRVLASGLQSHINYELSLHPNVLGLMSGEYVTDIRWEFGTVNAGFKEEQNPFMFVQVLTGLPKDYQIINRADVGGKYKEEWQTARTSWITTIFGSSALPPTLPKTGY